MKGVRKCINILGWCACAVAIAAGGAFFSLALAYNLYQHRAAQFDLARINEVSQRSLVYDCNGEFYSYLHGENRLVIPLDRVSTHFIDALLAREDARFWNHDGVDVVGVVRAAWTNFRAGDIREGASTLTQQLARGAFQMKERSIDRKALEAVLARRIEKKFSKRQILEFYVNRVYFGSGFYGIETAARGYFGKPAAELTLAESAMLAGLIRSPNKLSPLRDREASQEQAETVLERMHALHFITEDELAAAKQATPSVAQHRTMRFEDNYVMDAVKREVEALLPRDVVDFGGLRIFTTIDPELQQRAEAAADRKLSEIESAKNYSHPQKAEFDPGPENSPNPAPTKYLQAALVAIDNRTGAIRAIVGGRDYAHSKYPRALLARRQIGSTFKPFVYGAAFEGGLLPGTLVDDSRIRPDELRNVSNNWSPANSDDEYAGLQPAGWGLLKSRNTMAVRVGQMAGIPAVRKVAAAAGVGERIPDLPVAFLGAFETTLRELTAAYTVFPNLGVRRPAHLVARIESANGGIVYQPDQTERRALSAESAWMVSWVLQHVMKTGTASKAAALGWKSPGAGKTGTTNDFFDAWFVGYTTSLTCGVWVGMDEPQTIMERGYGSALALPIWVDFMKEVPQRTYPAAAFSPPARLFAVRVCSVSGGRATGRCEQLRLAYETQLPPSRTPMQWCAHHPEPHPPAYFAEGGAAPSLPPMQPSPDGSTAGVSMPPGGAAATVSHVAASTDPARAGGSTIHEPGAPPVILRDRQTFQPPAELPPDRIQFPTGGVRVLRALPVRRSDRVFYDAGRVWRGEVVREGKRRINRVAPPAEAEQW